MRNSPFRLAEARSCARLIPVSRSLSARRIVPIGRPAARARARRAQAPSGRKPATALAEALHTRATQQRTRAQLQAAKPRERGGEVWSSYEKTRRTARSTRAAHVRERGRPAAKGALWRAAARAAAAAAAGGTSPATSWRIVRGIGRGRRRRRGRRCCDRGVGLGRPGVGTGRADGPGHVAGRRSRPGG
jgi:hypothetical protein